jgi:hypothetical protein
VDAAGQRLVGAHEQARGAAGDVVGGRRGQRDREQRRQRRRRRVQLAHRRPARRAVAQVRPDLHQLLRRGLAVDDRRQQRQPALALGAALDPGVARHERAPALRDAAIDLRVRPAGLLADLGVGEALGLEPQRAQLLGLEPLQRLGRAPQPVEAHGALLGRGQVARLLAVEIGLLGADELLALGADRHRLVLADGVDPLVGALGIQRGGAADEDLHRPLVGVVCVVGAQRMAPRGSQQRIGVLRDDAQHQVARLRVGHHPIDIHVGLHPLLEVQVHLPL